MVVIDVILTYTGFNSVDNVGGSLSEYVHMYIEYTSTYVRA